MKIELAKDENKKRLKELKDKGMDKLSKEEMNEMLNSILEFLNIK